MKMIYYYRPLPSLWNVLSVIRFNLFLLSKFSNIKIFLELIHSETDLRKEWKLKWKACLNQTVSILTQKFNLLKTWVSVTYALRVKIDRKIPHNISVWLASLLLCAMLVKLNIYRILEGKIIKLCLLMGRILNWLKWKLCSVHNTS